MSPDTIAVGVFTIAGTLLGVIVGALTERLVRVTGRLRFECSSSSLRPDVGSAMADHCLWIGLRSIRR